MSTLPAPAAPAAPVFESDDPTPSQRLQAIAEILAEGVRRRRGLEPRETDGIREPRPAERGRPREPQGRETALDQELIGERPQLRWPRRLVHARGRDDSREIALPVVDPHA